MNVWKRCAAAHLLIHRSYAVRVQTGPFHPMKARFACGSVVLFYLFHKKFAQSANFL
jgi:hypothetical protein